MATATTSIPTVRPAISFDPNTDASNLQKAMKGFGTDEKAIIQILGRRTNAQRQGILESFQNLFGKDLINELKKELSGEFEDVIQALLTPMSKYLAQELRAAMKGPGTKENTLIELLCAGDNKSIKEIKAQYRTLYGKELEEDVKSETSGDFQKLILKMSEAARDEANCDKNLAHSLAKSLFQAGEKKRFGTDEAEFSRVVSSYSFPLLRCVFEEYEKISGKTFEHAINSELSGDYRDAIMAVFLCATNLHAFFAKALNDAMKGLGTRDATLIRIIISRCEIDMGNIKEEYNKTYGKKFEEAISSETNGDYKNLLLALLQG